MLKIAEEILDNGFTKLKNSYVQNFPLVKYDPTLARRRLLQMPLVEWTTDQNVYGWNMYQV